MNFFKIQKSLETFQSTKSIQYNSFSSTNTQFYFFSYNRVKWLLPKLKNSLIYLYTCQNLLIIATNHSNLPISAKITFFLMQEICFNLRQNKNKNLISNPIETLRSKLHKEACVPLAVFQVPPPRVASLPPHLAQRFHPLSLSHLLNSGNHKLNFFNRIKLAQQQFS